MCVQLTVNFRQPGNNYRLAKKSAARSYRFEGDYFAARIVVCENCPKFMIMIYINFLTSIKSHAKIYQPPSRESFLTFQGVYEPSKARVRLGDLLRKHLETPITKANNEKQQDAQPTIATGKQHCTE